MLLIDKKIAFKKKMSSGSENLIALILINNIKIKAKIKKKSKRPKNIWM